MGILLSMPSLLPVSAAPGTGTGLSGSFSEVAAGTMVNLTTEGEIDWVHWGLYTETSLDRKAGVVPQISDYTLVDSPAGFAYAYWFGDHASGYTWTDGTPTPGVTNSTTGVWAYGTPLIGSGFQVSAPADTNTRTLRVHVGAYGCRGQFAAYLSDGSSPGYTNSSLVNMNNGPGGVYTLNYRAASAGQQIIARWTLQTPMRPDGNVTLQAATLTASNYNNPPAVALTAPVNNGTFTAGSDITLSASSIDSDGTVARVEFFANGTKLGEDASSPFSFTWSNAAPGNYALTARATDAEDATNESAPVEIFVSGSGGSIVGSLAVPTVLPSAVNLTTEGSRDWVHWGLATNALLNRKTEVVPQISDLVKIGTNALEIYDDNYTAFSWTDGTPTAAAGDVRRGVYFTGITNGFSLTLPADTTSRTAKIYVGLYGAQGNFQAWLSDYRAEAYANTSLSNFFGNAYGVYTLTYAAASSGQTLHIRYRSLKLFDQDFGNVTLQAVTLTGGSTENVPPSVSLTNPADGSILLAPASFTLAATATDFDGSIAQVEFFKGTTSLGLDSTVPYSVNVADLAAGAYTFLAVATDDLGASATNRVSLIVNTPPAVILSSPTNGQVMVAPATILLSASADDPDGTVTNVAFFAGSSLLGNDATSPYTFNWTNVAAGTYVLKAAATDNRGTVTTSDSIQVSVGASPPEAVSLLNPTWDGTRFSFAFESMAGREYEAQMTELLGSGLWQPLTNIAGNGSVITVTDPNPSAPQRFYRIESK